MKKRLCVLVVACLGIICPERAFAQAIDPVFDKGIRHLLELSNAQKVSEQVTRSFVQQFAQVARQANPAAATRMIEVATDVARNLFTKEYDSLVPRMVAAYAKVLTPDDVKQLTAFYESPLGRRLIELSPLLSQASTQASQAWVLEVTPRLQSELQQRFKAEGLTPLP